MNRALGGARAGAAVLGMPIAHSLSPALHRAAYQSLGLANWTYRAIECDEAALAATLSALDDEGLAGASLTMPLKRAVMPMLARSERLAADVGAANTVVFGGIEGAWWGSNTDVPGMVDALAAAGISDLSGRQTVILGAGATASSAIAALSHLGGRDVAIAARRLEAADALAPMANHFGVVVESVDFDEATRLFPTAAVVVSTLPAGAADRLVAMVGASVDALLFDVVYDGWPTALASAWSAAGGEVLGGLELLVRQAAHQVRLMTGQDPDIDVMRAAGRHTLG